MHGVTPYKISNKKEALDEMAYLAMQFGYTVKYENPVRTKDIAALEKNYDAVFSESVSVLLRSENKGEKWKTA